MFNKAKTTDLTQLKTGVAFTWGESIKMHEIGPYAILEFHPWKRNGSTVLSGEPATEKTNFHAWVDGQDTAHGFESLDAALAGCIAYKHEGSNHRADSYFMKMLSGMNER